MEFMGRNTDEFQVPKPLPNEFQRQSSDARMGRGSTNEENWIDIETLMPAQDIGRLPETINDKRG